MVKEDEAMIPDEFDLAIDEERLTSLRHYEQRCAHTNKTVVCRNCDQNVYYEGTKPKKCPHCGSPL